jgi:hypothetical protein
MVHEIGDQEQAPRRRGQAFASMRFELEDGVEVEELDARAAEDLGARDPLEHLRGDPGGARVAVADGIFDEPPVAVDEPVVHAPAVHAEALHRTPE